MLHHAAPCCTAKIVKIRHYWFQSEGWGTSIMTLPRNMRNIKRSFCLFTLYIFLCFEVACEVFFFDCIVLQHLGRRPLTPSPKLSCITSHVKLLRWTALFGTSNNVASLVFTATLAWRLLNVWHALFLGVLMPDQNGTPANQLSFRRRAGNMHHTSSTLWTRFKQWEYNKHGQNQEKKNNKPQQIKTDKSLLLIW